MEDQGNVGCTLGALFNLPSGPAILQRADPLKVYPQLKGSFPENLKHLKSTMQGLDWKIFENWMHQWLLFEMSKNSQEEKPTEAPPKGTGSWEPWGARASGGSLGATAVRAQSTA